MDDNNEGGFFQPDTDINDFTDFMKRDREKMPEVTTPGMEDEPLEGASPSDGGDRLDDEEAAYLDYTEEQLYTAQLLLAQFDKVVAFGFSQWSGEDSDKYRKRINRPQGEDYEATLLAALLKKYQARLTLEYMFLTAMIIAYLPEGARAMEDRKRNKLREAAEIARRQQEAIEQKAAEIARTKSN